MTRKNKADRARGYTLLEVLVVIMIMGILATMVAGLWSLAKRKSRDAKAKAQLEHIASALNEFQVERGYLPEDQSDMINVKTCPQDLRELLLERIPPLQTDTQGYLVDPWFSDADTPPKGRIVYELRTVNQTQTYDLYSMGPDKADNTAEEKVDNLYSGG